MEIYDSEEEQVEALKKWWKANGKSAMSGVVIGIVVILGWNFWKQYQEDRALQSSALFQELLVAAKDNKTESTEKIAQRLAEQYDSTPYAQYAALFQAKEKVQAGAIDEAKDILKNLITTADTELQHVARIRLIQLMLASGEYEQGLQLIAEVDASSSDKFEAGYQELTGDLYAAMDRIGEARTAYQKALKLGQRTPLLQLKIDDLTAPEILQEQ